MTPDDLSELKRLEAAAHCDRNCAEYQEAFCPGGSGPCPGGMETFQKALQRHAPALIAAAERCFEYERAFSEFSQKQADAAKGGGETLMAEWRWVRGPDAHNGTSCWVLLDNNNATRAQVWGGVWSTFDENGVGGENNSEADDTAARVEAVKALKQAMKGGGA